MQAETINWHFVSEAKPDADETVLVHCPHADEPVWLAFLDGDLWRSIDGLVLLETVLAWARMPEGIRKEAR